jgi:proteasome lid subunit RPN8/RPN11
VIQLTPSHLNELFTHAREASPAECCGLIGGSDSHEAQNVYRLRNIASDPLVSYEAEPEDLFAAQRHMRERGEELLAIYHSHPRSPDPSPSSTDVRLAYYPSAIYLIIGLASAKPVMRAFRISERERHWEEVEYAVLG